MVLGLIGALFGGRTRMPRDQVTRIPRAAKKAAAVHTAGMKAALDKIGALPGLADIKENKRVPRGFHALVTEFLHHLDEYHEVVRKFLPNIDDVERPGEPGGCGACFDAPMPLHAVEALNIYRTIRSWRDFQAVAQRMGELGEQQFKDIQSGHSGKDPEKIRMGGRAVRNGRITFAKRMERCPMLDEGKQRCRIWEQRPLVCRMHHPTTPDELSHPNHESWPGGVKAINIRPPVQIQVALAQLDKRLMLQLSPFMYGGVLQLLQLAEGHPIQEVGEAPLRMQQDGQVTQRANRNVKHAKKFKKKKKK
jgi:Fe-S-cluster containining protein